MNPKFPILLSLAICCICPASSDDNPPPAPPEEVIVKTIDHPLPQNKPEQEKFLWDLFANKPDEKKFNGYTTDNWKSNFSSFAQALVQKAETQKLDSASLKKILDLISDEAGTEMAYLPVGAYQTTTLKNAPVWIVVVKWEVVSKNRPLRIGHIRMFAYDAKTLAQVALGTCL